MLLQTTRPPHHIGHGLSNLGERLTAAHQRAQRALTGNALKKLSAAWAAVDPADDASWLRYVAQAEELYQVAHTKSGQVAVNYFARFRRAELHALGLVADGFTVSAPGLALPGAVGERPGEVRAGVRPPTLCHGCTGRGGQPACPIRSVGKRDRPHFTVRPQRHCRWHRPGPAVYRVAPGVFGGACSFCAMLASQGAVYRDQKSAAGSRKGGGLRWAGCGCSSCVSVPHGTGLFSSVAPYASGAALRCSVA
ncbi:VG15 protein [Streptomyces sp. NPDC002446]